MKLFCIIDKKASAVVAVFSSMSPEAAQRSFMDLVTVPQDNIYNLHFDDFAVYEVGELFFPDGGQVSFAETMKLVFDGNTLNKLVVQSERERRLASLLALNKVAEGGAKNE